MNRKDEAIKIQLEADYDGSFNTTKEEVESLFNEGKEFIHFIEIYLYKPRH